MTRALLLAGLAAVSFFAPASSRAEDAMAYVVSYIEVAPASKDQAAALFKTFGEASRRDPGSAGLVVLQRLDRANHFAVVESWKDGKAQETHAAAAHTKEFREKLQPLLAAPYDERPHGALAVGAAKEGAPKDAVFAVTHVDFIPPKKDEGIAALQGLADPSRKDAGNIRYDVLQQTSRPNHLTLVEAWADQKALEAHETSAHVKQFRQALLPMSGSLFDQRLYKALD